MLISMPCGVVLSFKTVDDALLFSLHDFYNVRLEIPNKYLILSCLGSGQGKETSHLPSVSLGSVNGKRSLC